MAAHSRCQLLAHLRDSPRGFYVAAHSLGAGCVTTALERDRRADPRWSNALARPDGRRLSEADRRPKVSRHLLHAAGCRRPARRTRHSARSRAERRGVGRRRHARVAADRRFRLWNRHALKRCVPAFLDPSRAARRRSAGDPRLDDERGVGRPGCAEHCGSLDGGDVGEPPS